jgi:DNA invertase Pin-like site-specific DNA recombinase
MTNQAAVNPDAVVYLRVSTERQGRSGLGLEAQRAAVASYANDAGLTIVEEFLEVETGKGANALTKRPQLLAALASAKKRKAKLVLAKLDRLARNVHFISGLMETGVDFVAADMPHADRFQLHIFAAVAEHEARAISERTRAALQAAKERGCKADGKPFKGGSLGSHGRVLAVQRKAEAVERLSPVANTLAELRQRGLSMRAMVGVLNERGVDSPGGGKWHLANLHRAMKRLEAA